MRSFDAYNIPSMSFVAIVGAGPLGGAIAHKLALRDRLREIRLIDPGGTIARGKALDMLQSGPVDGFSTRVTSGEAIESAAGASAVVLADDAGTGSEHAGENGLALVRRLVRAGTTGPFVCAGASQRELIGRTVAELHVPRERILGSAPFALESALRALVALALDGSAVEIALNVVGVPPRSAVVAWEEATAYGQPLSERVAPHVLAGLSARIQGVWPPGPYALGSAAARIVEAIALGSRRRFSCFVTLDAGPSRHAVAAMPIELWSEGIRRIDRPALTRQERTLMETAIERG
jgi:malate dehydrogenase